MNRRSERLWNGASLLMAAVIHAGLAAWAASALSSGDQTLPMGKPRAQSMEINLAMIATPKTPEPVADKAEVSDQPVVKQAPKTVKKIKPLCYPEPPKPERSEPTTVRQTPLPRPVDKTVRELEPPVPDTAAPMAEPTTPVEVAKHGETAPDSPVFPPGMTSPLRPHYPRESRMQREEGEVTVWFRVRENGQAENIRIAKSSGYARLDKAAVRAVSTHKFIPAAKNDQPEDALCSVTISFCIRT